MQAVWQRAKGGHHQFLLVAGEPGIGKTQLALEFARPCGAEGSTVLLGYSDEENLVPYQTFRRVSKLVFPQLPSGRTPGSTG